jgi:hypothetical protein
MDDPLQDFGADFLREPYIDSSTDAPFYFPIFYHRPFIIQHHPSYFKPSIKAYYINCGEASE